MKKDRFVRDFKALQVKMLDPNPRAELIKELKVENRRLNKKYNLLVDTNKTMSAGEEKSEDQRLREIDEVQDDVSLYTTKHLGATREIYEFISDYLKKKQGAREGGQAADNSAVQSRNMTNAMSSKQGTATKDELGLEKPKIQASVNVVDYSSNIPQLPMIVKDEEVAEMKHNQAAQEELHDD